jgi:hypothetical protein
MFTENFLILGKYLQAMRGKTEIFGNPINSPVESFVKNKELSFCRAQGPVEPASQ